MATAKSETKIATGTIEGFTPPAAPVSPTRGKYPFDDLAVGEFFSVSGKTRRQMLAPVKRANDKYLTEAKDADGKVVSSNQEREFYAVEVDAPTANKLKGTDHEGATILIVRSK